MDLQAHLQGDTDIAHPHRVLVLASELVTLHHSYSHSTVFLSQQNHFNFSTKELQV